MKKKHFGIDKFVVGGLSVTEIDEKKFLSFKNEIKYSREGYLYFKSWNIESPIDFSYLEIKSTDYFNQLRIGIKKIKDSSYIPYVKLEIINNGEYRNLYPQSIATCSDKIDKAITFLWDYYGIRLKKDRVKFDEMEITLDIETDLIFEEYTGILKTFLTLAPKTYSRDIAKDNENKINAVIVKNNRFYLIIYNKTKHLATKKILIENNIMRFEYTLIQKNKGNKIKDIFGTVFLDEINEKMIIEFFKKQIRKDLFTPFLKNSMNMKKTIKEIFNQSLTSPFWTKEFLKNLNAKLDNFVQTDKICVFDIEILKDDIKKKDPKNFRRNYKEFLEKCPKSFINVDKKFDEIKNKILKNLSSNLEEL